MPRLRLAHNPTLLSIASTMAVPYPGGGAGSGPAVFRGESRQIGVEHERTAGHQARLFAARTPCSLSREAVCGCRCCGSGARSHLISRIRSGGARRHAILSRVG